MLRAIGLLTLLAISLSPAKNLEIYVIDVEGGKSVLFVSPSGQSMLFDAGWPASNNGPASTDRIADAVRAAGLKRIDFLVISHFDIDHIGDVAQLAEKVPIGHIYDHGDAARPQARFTAYSTAREKIGHTVLKAGDRVPIKGIDVQVLSAGGQLIAKPLPHAGAPNSMCAAYKQQDVLPGDFEDNQSIGLLIASGRFRMLDLADLEAHYSHDLACPNNLIGTVDVYNVNVHGQIKGIAPELIGAVRAPVIIQANGARKGADAPSWPILRASQGLKDIWQLHYSLSGGEDGNPPDDFIANPEGTDAFHWIRISASRDGSFTVTNSRNGFTQHYPETRK